MKFKKIFLLMILIFIFNVSFLFGVSNNENSTSVNCVTFFYGNGCPHCAKVEPFIEDMEVKYPNVIFKKFEVYNNRSNMILLNNYFDSHSIDNSDRGIPVIFIGNSSLIGDKDIVDNLDEKINDNMDILCNAGVIYNSSDLTHNDENNLETLSLITVISAALVDSINPCAIAVLLILLSALLAAGDKKKALRAGLAFTVSIYIIYFLFGLGLFSVIKISGLSYWFYKFIGFIAILIGLFNIKDYIWYGGGGFVMEIPRSWRPTLKKMLGKVTSPLGAFLIGFVVCLFELPCTGGPYIFILGLLAQKSTQIAAIPILLLYNLFFVFPLIIITLLIYKGFTNVENATKWKDKNLRVLHLVAGIVMLILGIIVLLGLV